MRKTLAALVIIFLPQTGTLEHSAHTFAH